ncbi:hypothetical protein BDF19DRAFT_435981 [Syncephalis fuscata]|nr:hypothetical protein BDF19DRAFT_435981 [Syncephalis fuscata]
MSSSSQACSTTGSLCPEGSYCYIQESGYFCQSNGTTGCIISDSTIKFVNKPLVLTGDTCEHCPVPNTIELRQQFKDKLTNIVQDQGWHTYGNCRDGFCSLNGSCKEIKKPYSLCLTSDQCNTKQCIQLSARNNQFACPDGKLGSFFLGHLIVGVILIILGILFASITFCRIRDQKQDFQLQMAQPQTAEMVTNGTLANPIKRHKKKMIARYICAFIGVALIIGGALYGFLPPAVFPHEDEN